MRRENEYKVCDGNVHERKYVWEDGTASLDWRTQSRRNDVAATDNDSNNDVGDDDNHHYFMSISHIWDSASSASNPLLL